MTPMVGRAEFSKIFPSEPALAVVVQMTELSCVVQPVFIFVLFHVHVSNFEMSEH